MMKQSGYEFVDFGTGGEVRQKYLCRKGLQVV